MSQVIILRKIAADSLPVAAATIVTGWKPGQCFQYNNTGEFVQLAITDNTMFVGVDATTELAAPPTGSLITGLYGAGTKFIIDHTKDITAGDNTRAYNATCESAGFNADLYVDASGKFTATATGSVKGKMFQVPTASNNYGLGVILRF